MKPSILTLKEKHLIGMKSAMRHGEYGNIIALWKQFMPRRHEIKSAVNHEFIAVQNYSEFNNLKAPFDICACIEVDADSSVPNGMEAFTIPEGEYAMFVHKGMNTSETYQRIMSEWLPNSGYVIDNRPHFQVMGEKYKNGSPDSEEDFYVPIRSAL